MAKKRSSKYDKPLKLKEDIKFEDLIKLIVQEEDKKPAKKKSKK